MGKKLILTEQQHTLIVNQILKETVDKLDELEAKGSLDENVWTAIKYGLSKLGRYKAGGNIMGKGKVDTQYAEKIKDILRNEANEMIKDLDDKIKETNPEFPNNKDPQQFLTTVMEIAAVYDSIVAATKKQPEEKGYMPIDAANGVINDLREYVKKFLDVDLRAIYSATNEAKDMTGENIMSEEYQLSEGQMCEIYEAFGLTENEEIKVGDNVIYDETQSRVSKVVGDEVEIEGPMGNKMMVSISQVQKVKNVDPREINEADPLDAADVRAGLQAKRGGGEDFSSDRMDTLKSNKLPMTLAGVGASLGAFSWLVNTEWFKSLFDVVTKNPSIEYIKQVVQEKTEVLGSIKPGEGMTQIMNRLNGMNLNPNSSPQEFISGVKTLGGGNINDGIDALTQQGGIFKDPEAARKALTEIVNNPNAHGSNLGQIFQGQMAGTGESFGDSLVTQTGGSLKGMIVNAIIRAVPKLVIKTGVSTGAGYLAAKGLAGILGPIGIGLVTAGAAVKLLRMKGQKSSRAATLNTLYQSIRNLEGGLGIVEPEGDTTGTQDGGTGQGDGQTGGAEKAKTNLYNNLKSLFQFIVNNKNTMGTKTQYNTGTGGAGAQAPLAEAKYITDKRVIQYLSKSLPFDKLKNFENLLNRIEIIRNSLKKMGGSTGDKALDGFLKQLDSNPIMLTNFEQLTKVDPNKAQEVNQLLAFIKETLLAVYSGDYKVGNMVDKMSTLGGGNINKLSEDELEEVAGYSAAEPNKSFAKDAQSRTTFKKNLVKFLSTIMNMFQYLHKTQGGNIARKDTSNKYTPPPGRQKQAPAAAPAQQSGQSSPTGQNVVPENIDPKLMEELKRIKKIMLS